MSKKTNQLLPLFSRRQSCLNLKSKGRGVFSQKSRKQIAVLLAVSEAESHSSREITLIASHKGLKSDCKLCFRQLFILAVDSPFVAPPFAILSKAVSASSRTDEYVAGKSSNFSTASG